MSAENTAYRNFARWIDNARNDVYGAQTTKTIYQVPPDFTPSAGDLDYLTLEHTLQSLANGNKKYTLTRIDGWPTLVSQEEEPQTGKKVTATRTFHDTEPDIGTNGTGRFVESVKPVNKRLWMKTVREIHSSILSETFYEHHSVDYYFPSYLDEDTPFNVIRVGRDSAIASNRSSDHEFKLPCRFEITYHTSAPTAIEVFQFKPVDIKLVTPQLTLREDNVITDGGTIEIAMTSYDEFEVPVTVTLDYTWPESHPNTTVYKILMGDEVVIADDSQRWKFNLWRRVMVWMPIPDLTMGLNGSLVY